jgi:hypothetical protein
MIRGEEEGMRPRPTARWGTVLFLALVGSAIARAPEAQRGPARALVVECLSLERMGCGCSLEVLDLACQPSHDGGWKSHFHSDLHQGAPLWIRIAGEEFPLQSHLPVTNSFMHGRGDRWQEEYEGTDLKVRVRYRPSKSTCPAEKEQDDGCEFFDVAADVTISRADVSRTYRTVGTCGC